MPELIAGRYEILRLLGAGGLGEVFLVRDTRDDSRVALKRLRALDAEGLARFREEFAVLARIHHPNMVRVHDYGELPGESAYFTMELLDGLTLDEAIAPGDVEGALAAARDVSAGLSALYAAGIVHCDLKPSNLMTVRSSDGATRTLIVDF